MDWTFSRWFTLIIICLLPFMSISTDVHASTDSFPSEIEGWIQAATKQGALPDKGAIILKKEISLRAEDDGRTVLRKRIIGMVLDDKAVSDYSQVISGFNSHFQKVTLDHARTYARGRAPLTLSPDALQVKTPARLSSAKTYSDLRMLTFSLPGLAPGTVFDYQITESSRPVIPDHWITNINFHEIQVTSELQNSARIDAVYQSNFAFDLPKGQNFNYALKNTKVHPRRQNANGRDSYIFEMNGLAPVVLEGAMPSLDYMLPMISVTSMKDYKPVARWASERFASCCRPSAEIKAALSKLVSHGDDHRTRVHAVYRFIQKRIEYVMADFGRSGYQPHTAGEVFKNGYGDCKDQTVLAIAMLKVLGIDAYPALLRTFPLGEVDPEVPAYDFNHAIVYIPHHSGDLWIDPTTKSRFPNLAWHDRDRLALIIDDKNGKFQKTPRMTAKDNLGHMTHVYRYEEGRLTLNIQITGRGAVEELFGAALALMEPRQQKEYFRAFIKNQYPVSEVLDVRVVSPETDGDAFRVDAKLGFDLKWNTDDKFVPYSVNTVLALAPFLPLNSLPDPTARQHDFQINFPIQIEAEWYFYPPDETFVLYRLPEAENMASPFFSYKLQPSVKDHAAQIIARFTMQTNRVAKADYAAFHADVQTILGKSVKSFYFKQQLDEKSQTLKKQLDAQPDDRSTRLELAKRYLTTGRYDEACTLLEKMVAAEEMDGEVQYYYGVSLGYVGRYDESGNAFKKAVALGFTP